MVASWSWDGHEGQPVTVEVYADADEVELLVNGRSLGRQPAGPDHRFKALFETEYEPGDLVAVAWQGDEEVGRHVLRSATGTVRLAVQVDRTEIGAGPDELAFVEVTLVDEAGTVVTTGDRLVTVEVEGPGVLQGLASGRPDPEAPYTGPTCTTFDGRALAVIRPTGEGTITVRVHRPCHRAPGAGHRRPMTWELRWHPFRGEWVLFTAHRGARPWIGAVVADDEVAVPEDNALAPLGRRIAETNPDYRGVFTFTNDLPVFSPDAPDAVGG